MFVGCFLLKSSKLITMTRKKVNKKKSYCVCIGIKSIIVKVKVIEPKN